jgi:hypothetical protein
MRSGQVELLAQEVREMGARLHNVGYLPAIYLERDLRHGDTARR